MKFNANLSNPAIFVVLWIALAAMVLHDIALRKASMVGLRDGNKATSERVVTREFVLVDDSGRTRARIGMNDKTQAPSIQLFDAKGQQRAQLRLNQNDVPSLRLYDADGSLKSVMGFTLNDMQPAYVTFDNNHVGHIENLNHPNRYQTVQDEDYISQQLLLGRPQSAPVMTSRYLFYMDTATPRPVTIEVAPSNSVQQDNQELQEAIKAEVEDARSQINTQSYDPFHRK